MSYEVQWPCVLKFAGSDELQFVGSAGQWTGSADFQHVRYADDDWLIDSSGQVFGALDETLSGLAIVDRLSLEQVVQLVRHHASVCGECCVSKMGAPSIEASIRLVDELV